MWCLVPSSQEAPVAKKKGTQRGLSDPGSQNLWLGVPLLGHLPCFPMALLQFAIVSVIHIDAHMHIHTSTHTHSHTLLMFVRGFTQLSIAASYQLFSSMGNVNKRPGFLRACSCPIYLPNIDPSECPNLQSFIQNSTLFYTTCILTPYILGHIWVTLSTSDTLNATRQREMMTRISVSNIHATFKGYFPSVLGWSHGWGTHRHTGQRSLITRYTSAPQRLRKVSGFLVKEARSSCCFQTFLGMNVYNASVDRR